MAAPAKTALSSSGEGGGGGLEERPPPSPQLPSLLSPSSTSAGTPSTTTLSTTKAHVLVAQVTDFSQCAVKQRVWWHLRHLYEPVPNDSDSTWLCEEGITVIHRVAQPVRPRTSPNRSRRNKARRKRSASFSSEPFADFATSPPSPSFGSSLDDESPIPVLSSSSSSLLTVDPSTQVFFVYDSYRIVFCLDFRRSLCTFQGSTLPIDHVERALTSCLIALTAEMRRPGFECTMIVTVIALLHDFDEVRTLVQAFPLSQASVELLVRQVNGFITRIENELAVRSVSSSVGAAGAAATTNASDPSTPNTAPAFERLLDASLLALDFLPESAAPVVVVVTDGIFQLGGLSMSEYDDAIMRLCRHDIGLSVVHVAPRYDPSTALGYIQDSELLRTALGTTGGCLLHVDEIMEPLPTAPGPLFSEMNLRHVCLGVNLGVDNILQASVLVKYSKLSSTTMEAMDIHMAGFDVPLLRSDLPPQLSGSASFISKTVSGSMCDMGSITSAPAGVTRREKLKMYGLPLIRLKKLLGLRASEGFQVMDMRVNIGSSLSRGGGERRSSRRNTPGAAVVADGKVLARLGRYLSTGLTVEYMLEYEPLAGTGGLGTVNISLEVVGPEEWMRSVRDVQGRRSDVIRQSIRKFCRALYEVDVVLCRVIGLLKSPQTADLGRDEARRRLSSGDDKMMEEMLVTKDDTAVKFRDLLWLGRMSVHEWRRWLWVEYFEVVGKIKGPDGTMLPREDTLTGEEEEEEYDEDEGDADDSPSSILEEVLSTYATQRASRDLFWKLFPEEEHASNEPFHISGCAPSVGITFCIIKVTWATSRLLGIHVGFFGISGPAARRHLNVLQEAILSAGVGNAFMILENRVAFQLVLPPEPPPAVPEVLIKPKAFFRYRLQNAQPLLSSYLQCRRWVWNLGNHLHLDVIAGILIHTKKADGFMLVEPLKDKVPALLLRRVTLSGDKEDILASKTSGRSALVQYRVIQDGAPSRLRTELWMEPELRYSRSFETLVNMIYQQDRNIISTFHSFYYLRHLCRINRTPPESTMEGDSRMEEGLPLCVLDLLIGAAPRELALKLFGEEGGSESAEGDSSIMGFESEAHTSTSIVTSINAHLYQWTEQTLKAVLGASVSVEDTQRAQEVLNKNPALASLCDAPSLIDSKVFVQMVGKTAISLWFLLPHRPSAAKLCLLVFVITEAELLWRFVGDDNRDFTPVPVSIDDSGYGSSSIMSRRPTTADPWEVVSVCMDHIIYMHRRNFTQAAYQALLTAEGRGVSKEDLKDALGYCSEFGIDVDLTQLRRISATVSSTSTSSTSSFEGDDSGDMGDGTSPHLPGGGPLEDGRPSLRVATSTLNGNEEFVKKLTHYLKPVPGTDYFFFSGNDQDLLEADAIGDTFGVEEWEHGILGVPHGSYHVNEPHAPEVAGSVHDGGSIGIYVRRHSGILFDRTQGGGGGSDPKEALSMFTDALDTLSTSKGLPKDASGEGETFNSAGSCCFVRFELVHATNAGVDEDVRRTQTFPLSVDRPPGEALTLSLINGPEEDIWSPPQTSRQSTAISIICATHSKLDTVKMDMALAMVSNILPPARDNLKEAIPVTHKRFLMLIRRQIEAWSAGEILRDLLAIHPLPEPAFPVILNSLRPLPSDALTKFNVDLAFVTDLPTDSLTDSNAAQSGVIDGGGKRAPAALGTSPSTEGLMMGGLGQYAANERKDRQEAMALRMFQEHLCSGTFLSVRRIHNVYFVMEAPPGSSPRPDHSTSSPRKKRVASAALPSGLEDSEHRIRYWVILQLRRRKTLSALPGSDAVSLTKASGSGRGGIHFSYLSSFTVHVALHHPPGTVWYDRRVELIDRIRDGILETCVHVNQLILLAHLHDTRLASPLLIAPTSDDLRYTRMGEAEAVGPENEAGSYPEAVDTLVADSTPATLGPRKSMLPFVPNQFACPCRLSIRFLVNNRMTPLNAIRHLESSVLHPFTVNNRVHTLVHRDRQGRVSYMKLEPSRKKDAITLLPPGQDVVPTLDMLAPPSDMDVSLSAAVMSMTGTSTLQTDNYIDLHVYSVDEVGEEISVQLRRLLESRLVEYAMNNLSDFLSRNTHFQFTPNDLDFIRTTGGQQKDATTRFMIELPPIVMREPYLFMLYLRQNVVRSQFINHLHVQSGQQLERTASTKRMPSLTSPGGKKSSPSRARTHSSTSNLELSGQEKSVHPVRLNYTQEKIVQTLASMKDGSSGDIHPAFWVSPPDVPVAPGGGLEVDVDPMTFKFYYNYCRPEGFEARKDFATSLSNKGMKLVKDVGRGIALISLNLADRTRNPIRRVRTAVGVTPQEVDDLLRMINGVKAGKAMLATRCRAASTAPATENAGTERCLSPDRLETGGITPIIIGSPERISGNGGSHRDDERWDLSALNVLVDVAGFVNAEPLVEWIKLCVDQTLHDYITERLLYSMRQPSFTPWSALPDWPNADDSNTSGGGGAKANLKGKRLSFSKLVVGPEEGGSLYRQGSRITQPLEDLLQTALGLESPSVRKFEASEVMPVLDFPRFAHALCHSINQLHPYFQSTLQIFAVSTDGRGGITPTDPAGLVSRPVVTPGEGSCSQEYIMLWGLKMAPLKPESPLGVDSLYSPPRLKSRMPSQAEDALGVMDVLYPSLTAAEGASPEMQAAKVTQRETVVWLRVTCEKQTLLLYNGHPQLFQRCVSAMQHVLSFVALYRFVVEGICLQRLGLVPLDMPWWKRVPGLQEVFEGLTSETPSPTKTPDASKAASLEQNGQLGERRGSLSDKPETSTSIVVGHAGEESNAPVQLESTLAQAAARKKRDNVPVMTPAMAARLRASGRPVLQNMNMRRKMTGTSTTPNQAPATSNQSSRPAPLVTTVTPPIVNPDTGKPSDSEAGTRSDVGTPTTSRSTPETLWQVPHKWMRILMETGDAAQLSACRRLSIYLVSVVVDVCPPPPLDPAAIEELCTSRDPLRTHRSRINQLVVLYFKLLSNRMKLAALCRPWTWHHNFTILQQRGAHLHLRTHRPLDVTGTKTAEPPVLALSPSNKADSTQVSSPSSRRSRRALKGQTTPTMADIINQVLRQARWQGAWSLPLFQQTSFAAMRLESSPMSCDDPLRLDPRRKPSFGDGDIGPEEPVAHRRFHSAEPFPREREEVLSLAATRGAISEVGVGGTSGPIQPIPVRAAMQSFTLDFDSGGDIRKLRGVPSRMIGEGPQTNAKAMDDLMPSWSPALDTIAETEESILALGADFTRGYVRHLTEAMKMVVINTQEDKDKEKEKDRNVDGGASRGLPSLKLTLSGLAGENESEESKSSSLVPQADKWPLRVYLRRPVPLTNTILLVEVLTDKRQSLQSGFAWEILVTVTLYTFDVDTPLPEGSPPPNLLLYNKVLGKRSLTELPTTHSFTWPDDEASTTSLVSLKSSLGIPPSALCGLIPREVGALASQLELQRHIYDYLVEYVMDTVEKKGDGTVPSLSGTNPLDLLRYVITNFPEPPRNAHSAISRRFICQPVHGSESTPMSEDSHPMSWPGIQSPMSFHTPDKETLLRYIERYAGRYQLKALSQLEGWAGSPLHGITAFGGPTGVYGTMGPADEGDHFMFIMTVAEEQSTGFVIYILHSKKKRPPGLRDGFMTSSYTETIIGIEKLLARVLEDASFDLERDRVWHKLQRCIIGDSNIGGIGPEGEAAAHITQRRRRAFSVFDLGTLLCFSWCQPVDVLDPTLAPLLEGDLRIPWLEVLHHLERVFHRHAVSVFEPGLNDQAMDLLISCSTGHTESNPPSPQCTVLLHISYRVSRSPEIQIVTREQCYQLSNDEQLMVGRCLQRALGWIWSTTLPDNSLER